MEVSIADLTAAVEQYEKRKALMRDYYARNKDKMKETSRLYREKKKLEKQAEKDNQIKITLPINPRPRKMTPEEFLNLGVEGV